MSFAYNYKIISQRVIQNETIEIKGAPVAYLSISGTGEEIKDRNGIDYITWFTGGTLREIPLLDQFYTIKNTGGTTIWFFAQMNS